MSFSPEVEVLFEVLNNTLNLKTIFQKKKKKKTIFHPLTTNNSIWEIVLKFNLYDSAFSPGLYRVNSPVFIFMAK